MAFLTALPSMRTHFASYLNMVTKLSGQSGLTTRQIHTAAAGSVAAIATIAATKRLIIYRNPNVRAARAVRRARKGTARVNAGMGGKYKPGARVRYTSARAGSIRAKSDRYYSKAGTAEERLGRYTKTRKARGKARLRIQSRKFPTNARQRAMFAVSTSGAVSAGRGLRVGIRQTFKSRRPPRSGYLSQATQAGYYRGKSDRLRYKANKSTAKQQRAITHRRQQIRTQVTAGHAPRRIRTRRDSRGRYAGSY